MRNIVRAVSRKLVLVLLVSMFWFGVSVFTSALLTTTSVPDTEAVEVPERGLQLEGSEALWALIIPTTFFIVLSTRPRSGR